MIRLILARPILKIIPDWLQDLGEPVAVEKSLEVPLPQTMQPEDNLPTELDDEGISNLGIVAGISAAAGLLDADQQDEEPLEEMPAEMAEELHSWSGHASRDSRLAARRIGIC